MAYNKITFIDFGMNHKRPILKREKALRKLSEDEFGLKTIIHALADVLVEDISNNGYVIGIEGDWGSGKTTFTNFIAERIKSSYPQQVIMIFDPWLVGSTAGIISLFFGQLAAKVESISGGWSKLKYELAEEIRTYGRYASTAGNLTASLALKDPSGHIAAAAFGLKAAGILSKLCPKRTKRIEELKKEIHNNLLQLEKKHPGLRFLIIIDDTDRLEPKEATEVLRLIRELAPFPLVNYLVCFDRDILREQVCEALQISNGEAYIEKFFQNIISVPPQEPFALRRYLRKLLGESFPHEMEENSIIDENKEYRRHLLFNVWCAKFITTPRDVVRLHEAIKIGWPHISENADFIDFVWLQLIKLKVDALYRWSKRYLPIVGAYRDSGRESEDDEEQLGKELVKIIEDLGWEFPNPHYGLSYFLPGITKFVVRADSKKIFHFAGNTILESERFKRLGSPTHWKQYYAFSFPSYAVTDQEIKNFLQKLQVDLPQLKNIILDLFERGDNEKGYCVEILFERLSDSADQFSDLEARNLVIFLSDIMDEIALKRKIVSDSWDNNIWRNSLALLHKAAASTFCEMVEVGKSINWIAKVLRDQCSAHGIFDERKSDFSRQWLTEDQVKSSIQILNKRFENIGFSNILRMPAPFEILLLWKSIKEDGKFQELFDQFISDDNNFLLALDDFRGRSTSKEEPRPLSKETIRIFTDAEAAVTRLANLAISEEMDISKKAQELQKALVNR